MLPIDSGLALPVASLVALAFIGLLFFASPTLIVTETTISAKGAEINRNHLGTAILVPKSEVFEELGSKLDSRAWLSIQASVKGLVRVPIKDPSDPTPYWLISTRKPEKLIELLNS